MQQIQITSIALFFLLSLSSLSPGARAEEKSFFLRVVSVSSLVETGNDAGFPMNSARQSYRYEVVERSRKTLTDGHDSATLTTDKVVAGIPADQNGVKQFHYRLSTYDDLSAHQELVNQLQSLVKASHCPLDPKNMKAVNAEWLSQEFPAQELPVDAERDTGWLSYGGYNFVFLNLKDCLKSSVDQWLPIEFERALYNNVKVANEKIDFLNEQLRQRALSQTQEVEIKFSADHRWLHFK